MNKHTLKQTINYLNEFSLSTNLDLIDNTLKEVSKQTHSITRSDILETIEKLERLNALEIFDNTIDMFPCTVIFGRSSHNSDIEALAAYEIALRSSLKLSDPLVQKLLKLTNLYKDGEIRYEIKDLAKRIEQEAKTDIITETLNILYTKTIVDRKLRSLYRNEDKEPIRFDNEDFILSMIPRRGIPVSREETKDLQTFFKDTQMHEFDHACPICHIRMPHMLIASHIKPFRDCAHIYETATHDNGLLLCRNHDFLFDQGYISFDNQGYLLISKALKEIEVHLEHFNFCEKLDDIYLTENRKKFLKYHREHIFKK